MKLLLVNPYFGQGRDARTEGATHSPPLGLGFLATYVRDHSACDVEVLDPLPQGIGEEEALRRASLADVVGLTCYADTRFYCFDFAEKVKRAHPGVLLVVGGPHTFALDEAILQHYPFVDLVVRGEGEETLLEIVQGKARAGIQGVTYRTAAGIVRNPDRAARRDIDAFRIDYRLLPPLEAYGGDVEAPAEVRKLRTIYTVATRGCPFHCSYCANIHWGQRWCATSPAELVARIRGWVEELGVEYVRFYDDLFTASRKWVLEFCRLLGESGLRVRFRVLVRAGTGADVLEALRDAGCVAVGFGIESGSDRILKRIDKRITRQQIVGTLRDCRRLGLWTIGAFIVSLPDETLEDYEQSLSLVPLLDTFQTNIQIIFPFTPFYEELKARGEIADEVWFQKEHEGRLLYTRENFPSARFSQRELEWMALRTQYRHFQSRPGKVIEKYGAIFGSAMVLLSIVDGPLRGRLFRFVFRFRSVWRQILYR
jgi:radical SAM superfamily enzyme YgiQ (UPF0313 family)